MAEKIKCGEYVRTNTGIIDKVIDVRLVEDERKNYPEYPYWAYYKDKYLLKGYGYWRTAQNIVKHSKKISNIIELGDYVNGTMVDEAIDGTLGIVEIDEFVPINEVKIKSVVTREQFRKVRVDIK